MRSTHLKTCAIALTAALAMPAFAQSTTGGSTGSTGATTGSAGTTTTADTTTRRETDRSFDWGWLGLIGLAGLMGRRKQADTTYRADTTTGTRTTGQR